MLPSRHRTGCLGVGLQSVDTKFESSIGFKSSQKMTRGLALYPSLTIAELATVQQIAHLQ